MPVGGDTVGLPVRLVRGHWVVGFGPLGPGTDLPAAGRWTKQSEFSRPRRALDTDVPPVRDSGRTISTESRSSVGAPRSQIFPLSNRPRFRPDTRGWSGQRPLTRPTQSFV
jgi:hypothetical protein